MGSRPRRGGISDQSSLPTAAPSISDDLKVTSSCARDRPRLEENRVFCPHACAHAHLLTSNTALQQECLPQPLFES